MAQIVCPAPKSHPLSELLCKERKLDAVLSSVAKMLSQA